ncbi:MAG TPA: adenylate/guanylate cyclase domain-containing protein [Elusimicrobiota bacterium]|nr:adenylate/guanylate cyclase domain-containing protein [Elusimicrobiota bacterium]
MKPAGPRRLDARSLRWLIPLLVLAAVSGVRVFGGDWVEGVQFRAFDAYENRLPRPYVDAGVRVVDIDEKSLTDIGQWPWPRDQIAALIRALSERGAAVVAFDGMFPEPDQTSPRRVASRWPDGPGMREIKERVSRLEDHDEALARQLKRSTAVLGFAPEPVRTERIPAEKGSLGFISPTKITTAPDGTAVVTETDHATNHLLDFPGAITNLPALDAAARGLGGIGYSAEQDGIIRRAPLIFSVRETLYPALSIEALRAAQNVPKIIGKLRAANPSWWERWTERKAGIDRLKIGKFIVKTDESGRMWVHFTRETKPRTIPAWKVMNRKTDIPGLDGAVVFIGTSALGLKDLRATPLSGAEPGVQIHANIVEQIILGDFLDRPVLASRLEIAATIVGGLLLLLLLVRVGATWSAPAALAMIAAAIWTSWHAYASWRWLIDPVFPTVSLAAVFASFAATSYVSSERDRRKITDTFGRYLSPKVVENLAKNPGGVELGGETREMTFHFCDIRGFTTISEKFDPHGLTAFINRFLTPMTQIILDHDGTIDKYMGDCIMAFWNAPMSVPGHAKKACAAALAMHAKLAELNAAWQADAKAKGISLPEIHIGTGLNTGPCVVGNMGSTLRVDYTVLGDDVNLASRLEGQSKAYGVDVVIGPGTREQAPEFAAIELDLIKVKGKTRPVRIFALLGDAAVAASPEFQALAKAHADLLAAYRGREWEELERLLKEARRLGGPWRLGKLYDLYSERLAACRLDPPVEGWDGVFTATSK